MRRLALPILLAVGLSGCGARDCVLGIAERDCPREGLASAFPQDDTVCESYGLRPGTHDFETCHRKKAHERLLTGQSTDYGALSAPLGPNFR